MYKPKKPLPLLKGPNWPRTSALRIVHIHDAKTLKIRPLWHVLLHYFITRPSIKNLYDPFFDQVAKGVRSV